MVGRAHITGKNCVFGGKLVEHPDHVLRMDRSLARSVGREFIQALARFPVVFERGLQVLIVFFVFQSWQKGAQRRLRVPHKAVINLGAPAQLFSPDVDLHHRRILGIELLIREVGPDHQQQVAVHHGVIARRKSQQAGHAHVERVVVLDEFLSRAWRARSGP